MRIETLKEWNDDLLPLLSAHARKEVAQIAEVKLAIANMAAAWQVWDGDELLCLVGVYQSKGLIAPKPEVWFLAGKAKLTPSRLKQLYAKRIELFALFPTAAARIPPAFSAGCRFAEFFGLKPVHESPRFRTYEVM